MTSVDETLAVLELLEAQSALDAFQFFADAAEPVAGYKPADGVAVCFKVRGGADDDTDVVMDPSLQFKVYAEDELACRAAARILHDNFQGKADANVMAVRRESIPVTLNEPETNWTYCLVFYQVMVRSI